MKLWDEVTTIHQRLLGSPDILKEPIVNTGPNAHTNCKDEFHFEKRIKFVKKLLLKESSFSRRCSLAHHIIRFHARYLSKNDFIACERCQNVNLKMFSHSKLFWKIHFCVCSQITRVKGTMIFSTLAQKDVETQLFFARKRSTVPPISLFERKNLTRCKKEATSRRKMHNK